jgi:hypothetical protein
MKTVMEVKTGEIANRIAVTGHVACYRVEISGQYRKNALHEVVFRIQRLV